ncbi:hypothetical protein L593_01780 [Salinarchaeum sp. Harcht-Bsk1]|nr:hypothetical protein L593_01780 [Salinarchaeum sp. Harcht-Bsk1]
MRNSTTVLLALVALVALAPIVGVVGAADVGVGTQDSSANDGAATTNASTGAQLATVIQVTDEEVRHDVEVGSLEAELDAENDSERAAAIANLSATLQDRAGQIAADYEAATMAYDEGELSAAEYGQRLAVLHARADAIQNGFDRVSVAAAQTSPDALEAAGYNAAEVAEARQQLRSVSGSGTAALLAQFTGQSDGEFSVETENGLEVEVESEDGEYSRGFEGEEPEHGTFEVNRSEAQATAEAALSSPDDNGTWTLDEAETEDDGYYEFEFEYQGPSSSGEAEVSVDARENAVFSLEEEIEREAEDDGDDEEDDESEGELTITVVDGDPATDDTVTIRVTDAEGNPVAGADVEVDDGAGGTTDENGTVTVQVGEDGFDVEVEHGDSEGELEMEFEGDDSDDSSDDSGSDEDDGDDSDDSSDDSDSDEDDGDDSDDSSDDSDSDEDDGDDSDD